MYKFSKYFVTIFGLGFFPYAPGTIGSLFSIILFNIFNPYFNMLSKILLFLIFFLLSILTIKIYSDKIKKNDSKEIVIDEFLGLFLIYIFYEYIKFSDDLLMTILIFLIFRFFDILKIYPANWIDKNIKNSFGVILDDLCAGFYTILILLLINVLL